MQIYVVYIDYIHLPFVYIHYVYMSNDQESASNKNTSTSTHFSTHPRCSVLHLKYHSLGQFSSVTREVIWYIIVELLVEPTHPKNIGQIDAFRKEKGENNTSLKPPTSFETDICFLSELLFKTSTIYPATGSKE